MTAIMSHCYINLDVPFMTNIMINECHDNSIYSYIQAQLPTGFIAFAALCYYSSRGGWLKRGGRNSKAPAPFVGDYASSTFTEVPTNRFQDLSLSVRLTINFALSPTSRSRTCCSRSSVISTSKIG